MNKTVGQILRDTRELKDISLQDAARATHIRIQYLQELENDHPELLPSRAQAHGFLRLYASFLGLDAHELLSLWQPVVENQKKDVKAEKSQTQPDEQSEKTSDSKERVKDSPRKEKKGRSLPRFLKREPARTQEKESLHDDETEMEDREQAPDEKEIPAVNSPRTSSEAFREVGEQMRSRREKLGLSLSDVEQFTRLRRIYIQAIEEGRIEDLPSSVQGRGMVINYATFLEMDQDAVLSLYAEGLEIQRRENLDQKWVSREPAVKVSIRMPDWLRRFLSPDLLFGSLVVIALFGFIFWGASQIFKTNEEELPTDAPSISEVLQSTATIEMEEALPTTETTTTVTLENAAQPVATQPAVQNPTPLATANAAPLQLYIVAQQRAWMRVTVDGVVEFEGRIVPGNAYTFSGDDRIVLLCGNGAALEAYFNQEYLGSLGEIGEVVNLDFSLEGLTIPTPTVTPTLEATATPTQILTESPADTETQSE